VHLNPGAGITNETTTKGDCANAACYAGAWDMIDVTTATPGTTGITNSDRLLAIVQPDGTYQDVVAFTTNGKSPSGFPGELQAAQTAGMWMPADCGGAPCTFTSAPTAEGVSVVWAGTDTSVAAGKKSVQRMNPAGTLVQTHSNADWNAPAANTFGAANP